MTAETAKKREKFLNMIPSDDSAPEEGEDSSFLLSEELHITGQTIEFDGGLGI
jgi:hypothetical protein